MIFPVQSFPQVVFGRTQHSTFGPERALVDAFVAHLTNETGGTGALTVFREPRLETGFPDVVIVRWSAQHALLWRDIPTPSTPQLRLLQALVERPRTSSDTLKRLFSGRVDVELSRLADWGLIENTPEGWSPKPLEQIFGISSIVAIEAKMSSWRQALRQAVQNTWFASHSYVLVPEVTNTSSLLPSAVAAGIGVWAWATEGVIEHVPAQEHTLPRSYASWLFGALVVHHLRLEQPLAASSS